MWTIDIIVTTTMMIIDNSHFCQYSHLHQHHHKHRSDSSSTSPPSFYLFANWFSDFMASHHFLLKADSWVRSPDSERLSCRLSNCKTYFQILTNIFEDFKKRSNVSVIFFDIFWLASLHTYQPIKILYKVFPRKENWTPVLCTYHVLLSSTWASPIIQTRQDSSQLLLVQFFSCFDSGLCIFQLPTIHITGQMKMSST